MSRAFGRPAAKDAMLLCLDALSVAPDSDNDPQGFASEAAARARDDWRGAAARLLEHARGEGWAVSHVISRRPRPGEPSWRPVAGMAPTPVEPVYHREEPSAFSSLELCEALTRDQRAEVVVCGVSIQGSCLATALDALRLKVRLTIVMDAILLAGAERAGLDGFLRLQALGLTQSAVRLAASDGLAPPGRRLRLLQGGRA